MKTITKQQRIKEGQNLINAGIRHIEEGGMTINVDGYQPDEQEPLLPPGVELEDDDRKPQRNQKGEDIQPLYPVGINPK